MQLDEEVLGCGGSILNTWKKIPKRQSSQLGFLKNKSYEEKDRYESYGPHG